MSLPFDRTCRFAWADEMSIVLGRVIHSGNKRTVSLGMDFRISCRIQTRQTRLKFYPFASRVRLTKSIQLISRRSLILHPMIIT